MEYKSNQKHSEPWQRGRRGSLCPKEVRGIAAELLDGSELVETRRYAIHDGKEFSINYYSIMHDIVFSSSDETQS